MQIEKWLILVCVVSVPHRDQKWMIRFTCGGGGGRDGAV